MPRQDFQLLSGKPKEFDAVGDSGRFNKHMFCGNCGSSLYTQPELLPDIVCVKAGGLDQGMKGIGQGIIEVEWYAKDRCQYMKPVDGVRQEQTLSEDDLRRLKQVLSVKG